ncbi:ABC transporter permease [Halopseudomonas laoshanensis]|uniref:ABC transporter permease n=2 Tax=Halopseudomonas TaxID=2901189 RepID=A0A7V7GX10_9GAMM|nr:MULTISPECIES: ABC transporter permease [Halopseudomonas]KAA0696921.1 ABC transporter permease [Halopseudomonas laoshanensis]PCC97791.1 spermidine/putrescine ABC transporter permease [Halopseudomonas pelagia]QFY57361.1 ABC transporter permease [Halopseudomonas pelagia]
MAAPKVAARRLVGMSTLLLMLPLLLWLFLLIFLPHLDMFAVALRERVGFGEYRFSWMHFELFFSESLYWRTFLRTAVMSMLTTLLTLIIALPIAWYIAKLVRGRVRSLLFMACLIPFWVSELVRTYGWMILLRESGVISGVLQWSGLADAPVEMLYNDVAIMVGLIYASMLFMLVPLVTTLDSLDNSLVEAAYDLGGNHFTVTRDIIIPHAMPGIVSGSIVVFMLSLGNYLTPVLLGGKDSLWFTEQIFTQFITRFNWEQGAAFGVLLLVLSSLIVWLGLKLSGQSFAETMK